MPKPSSTPFILWRSRALIFWCCFLLGITCSPAGYAQAWAEAHFRGTPNNWASTAMVKNAGTGLWETQQNFSGANPRFKISRYANNWNEAYPAQDYAITNGAGDYRITFNDATKAISVSKIVATISANNICYNNATNHANPFIYFWNPVPAGSVNPLPAWPGRSMTQRANFYCYDFSADLANGAMPTSLRVIFSSNGGAQTADLTYNGAGCYENGVWKSLQQCGFALVGSSSSATSSSSSSVVSSSSSVTSSSNSSSSSSSISSSSSSSVISSSSSSSSSSSTVAQTTRIYFRNDAQYAAPHIHYFNVLPAIADSAWPGVAMRNLGGGWYSYDFAGALITGGVVFNNQGAPQTADLTFVAPFTCYSSGTWQLPANCGAPSELVADAGADRAVNVNSRQVLSAAASLGNFVSATWTSPAWTGTLTGAQVITPVLSQTGNYTVTLTLTDAANQTATDTFVLNVVAAQRGLPERPQLATPLKFPITGNVSSGDYRFEKAYPNLDDQFPSPMMVVSDGINDLIYVADKIGTIFVFPNDEGVTTQEVRTLLNINNVVRNYHEQGLLSMAFDPNYASNGYFYIYYIHGTDDNERAPNGQYGDAILERWTVNNPYNPTAVVANSKVEILRVPQPGPDHKGGMMQFHAEEGYLYLSIGDGAYGHSAITSFPQDPRTNNNAQITSNLLGTMIRIQLLDTPVDGKYYAIPSDNPFVNNPAFRGEIWSYGHRNPWRWAFDTEAPYTLWQTEVGQAGFEEVNLIQKGKNYGWPVCEGLTNRGALGGDPGKNCSTDFEPPRDGYSHPTGFSIIGGVVYRGNKLPNLTGSFIFGDYVTKRIWAIVDGEQKELISDAFPENIVSFGTDLSGEELLVSTYGVEYGGRSTIYRVVDDAAAAVAIPATLSGTGLFADLQNLVPVSGVIEYSLNSQGWFDGAQARHFIAIPNNETIGFDPTQKWELPVGTVLVKHLSVAAAGNPQKPFTTSVLFRQQAGWQAANYHWNAAGTDATLVTETASVMDGGSSNRQRILQSAADCGSCHVGSGSRDPLAMDTRQFNRAFNYQGVTDNQLEVFDHIGLFDVGVGNANNYDALAAADDANADITARVKAYLHTNCAHCHSSSFMDMQYDTPLEQMRLINVATSGNKYRVRPASTDDSVVYIYQTTDGNRMPKGSLYTNPVAENLFSAWINGLGADAVQTGVHLRSNRTQVAVGSTVTLTLDKVFDSGLTGAVTGPVSWTSSNPAVLDVANASGASVTLTANALGTVIITAQADSFSDSIQLTVTGSSSSSSSSSSAAPITAIEIAPASVALADAQQLVAYGVRSDGKRANIYGQVNWQMASGANVASVSASGLLTRLTSGPATVQASYQGLTATLDITSVAPGLSLRYDNPNGWSTVRIYLWTVVNGTNRVVAPWPGSPMTPDGAGWWTFVVAPEHLHNDAINVIFTNGSGGQTGDLLNISESSSYSNGAWTPWNPGNNNPGELFRLSVIGGVTATGERDFRAGSVVTITANDPPYGTNFTGWTGDGLPYVFTNPAEPVVKVVIPDHGLSLQALFDGDTHGPARELFAGQCASCHGTNGAGGVAGALDGIHDSSAWTLEILADYINDFMPMGNTSQCVGTNPGGCAYDIANMIIANAWVASGGGCTGPACDGSATDSRNLRLLTREEYLNTVRDIFAINFPASLMTPVPADGRIRNFDTASFLVADNDRTLGYEMVAAEIADQAITAKGFTGLVSGCSNNACVVQNLGRKLFRRPLSASEASSYLSLFDSGDAGRTLVQALLMSPHFMYRSELGVLDAETGLYRLTNYEIATLLSYTFWVTAPDDALLSAAESGSFNIAAQVERLLADPRAERGLRRFAGGWLVNNQYGFAGIPSPTLVEAFKEETIRFVIEAIKDNKPYNSLLSANYTYVNSELAQHYGMAPVAGNNWVQAFYASGDQRSGAGLLGHGSFLASRTNTVNPAPIKRGVYVREALMCQEFPPPAAADFNVVFEPSDSNRDATARHTSDPACASCHQYIDGVGFGFESFGSDALFRTIETLGNGETRAIDASGAIKSLNSPETTLDPNSPSIAYNSIPELAGLIAGSGQGEACYSRQFYRYTLGRNETLSDEPIIRAYSAGVRNGGGLRDMLVDLTLSDSFVLRR